MPLFDISAAFNLVLDFTSLSPYLFLLNHRRRALFSPTPCVTVCARSLFSRAPRDDRLSGKEWNHSERDYERPGGLLKLFAAAAAAAAFHFLLIHCRLRLFCIGAEACRLVYTREKELLCWGVAGRR